MRTLLPSPGSAMAGHVASSKDSTLTIQSAPKVENSQRNLRKTMDEWQRIKSIFIDLYVEQNICLKAVAEQLKRDYGFTATYKQFYFMIKKWKINKNFKTNEMRHIVRIQRKRLRGNPSKEANFRIRHRLVNRLKIERFEREHDTVASPESGTPSVISWSSKTSEEPRSLEHHRSINIGCQQLGKEQSTQEDGNLIRPPAPQAFDWWNSYAQFWTRQHSPKPNQAPLFEILQAMMLPRDTFDKEMFYKSKAREFEVIKVEACSHGIQYASSGFKYEGLWIADFGNFNLRCRYLWASGSLKLSYMPDPLWALSEVSKNFLRFGYYLRPVHMTMLSAYCFRLGRSAEARKFYEASIKALRPLDKLSDFEGLMTLGLVSTAIFSHEFDTARYLLKDVLNKRIGSLIYADDHEQFASPCSSAAQQLKKLVRDKVSSQLKVIEWFESNPKSRHKVFGTTESYGFASHCPGLTINEFHFCFGKVCIASPCPIYALRPTEADRNMFNLDVTYPVVSGMADLGFFEWQYFWRYLRAYGHMLEEMVSDEKQ